MHKARPHAQAPQWRRAEFVRGILRPGLDNAVAGLEVMQQEIAVGRCMILLPSAAGTAKAPPLIGVPGGAVVLTWT